MGNEPKKIHAYSLDVALSNKYLEAIIIFRSRPESLNKTSYSHHSQYPIIVYSLLVLFDYSQFIKKQLT